MGRVNHSSKWSVILISRCSPLCARTAISHSRSEYGSPPPPSTPSTVPATVWYGRLRYTVVVAVEVGVGVDVLDDDWVGAGVGVGDDQRARSPTRSSQEGSEPRGAADQRTPEWVRALVA